MTNKIAVYLRLSDEDSSLYESNSITSQRELLNSYINSRKEFEQAERLEFCDDGYSGTNFNRPGIINLLSQTKCGEIKCIIVKDFSRFGRNYVEVGNYIEQVFPFLGVRFISVNDEFDSDKASFGSDFMGMAFKNVLHDLYSKDLSEKIRSVRRMKAQQGEFVTAFAPYGFLKDENKQLIIDDIAAPIVKRIFEMAFEDTPKTHIARQLNEENIPTPLMLRKMRKDNFPCYHVNEKCIWKTSVVSAILRDRRYVGDAVYGKCKPTAVGSGKDMAVPPEDWIIVTNAHPAIVSREIFENVNAKFLKNRKYKRSQLRPLQGKIKCGSCNHTMSPIIRKNKTGEFVSYECQTPSVSNIFSCSSQSVSEIELEKTVISCLNHFYQMIYESNLYDLQKTEESEKIKKTRCEIHLLETDLQKFDVLKLKCYEDYREEKLKKEEYIARKSELEEKQQLMQKEKSEKEKIIQKYNVRCQSSVKSKLANFYPFQELTREISDCFLDSLVVNPDGTIKIKWKFSELN